MHKKDLGKKKVWNFRIFTVYLCICVMVSACFPFYLFSEIVYIFDSDDIASL